MIKRQTIGRWKEENEDKHEEICKKENYPNKKKKLKNKKNRINKKKR